MWDVRSKEISQRITNAHQGTCFWVDVHGDTMATAGKDGLVKVFRHKPRRKSPAAENSGKIGQGRDEQVNGVMQNGHYEESNGPDSHAADEELQRQVEAEDTSQQLKPEDVKMEQEI